MDLITPSLFPLTVMTLVLCVKMDSSKALLVSYVQSESVTGAVTKERSDALLDFLRNNVFPYEDHFAGHHYCYTFSFDEYSNTALEGTNNGLKHNANAVRPSMSLAKAGKCMIDQDATKSSVRKRKASSDFNTQPLYTGTNTSRFINDVAEDMLKEQIYLSHNYSSMRRSESLWLVRYTAERSGDEVTNSAEWTVPVFERSRKVYVNKEGGLECTCGYTARNGIPDRHIIHVAMTYGTDFGGFTHHNVHIRFWKAFEKFVAEGEPTQMQTSEQNLREKLQQARFSPKLIIHVPKGFPAFAEGKQFEISQKSSDHLKNMDAATVQEYFLTGIETPTVKNYDKAFVARAVAKMTGTSSVHSVGLSQEIHIPGGDDGENEDFGESDDNMFDFSNQTDMSLMQWQLGKGMANKNSHQILFPRFKELTSIYDGHPPEKIMEVAAVLDELIQKGKAENAAMVQQQIPVGQFVSAVGRNMHARQHKQAKQVRYSSK